MSQRQSQVSNLRYGSLGKLRYVALKAAWNPERQAYTGAVKRSANVAVLLFDDVEALDFCGPVEVFSAAGLPSEHRPFHVWTTVRSSWRLEFRPGSTRRCM